MVKSDLNRYVTIYSNIPYNLNIQHKTVSVNSNKRYYTIIPFVEGICPARRESISIAERIARAAALNKPSIL